jgi:deazaflavin-dependent oxidoreductase (nitroreductase family)
VPSDHTLRAMNAVHRLALRLSRGRIGWTALRMPVLELTTTGRKSGERRSTLLTSPIQVGRSYIVVASRGGDDTHPAWFLNLRDEPRVQVTLQDGKRHERVARIATADERAALWPRVTRDHANYARYQGRTRREIPLVFLDPLD